MADSIFLIACRIDNGEWQAIFGGGEDHESLLEAAKRELYEETSLTGIDRVQLDSMCILSCSVLVLSEPQG